MNDINLEYFCQKHIDSDEEVVSSIECRHEGNPFIGTLILTDNRLAFVRKGEPGFENLSIKSSLITGLDQRIEQGIDFMLIVRLEKFSQEFELRGLDMARKQVFVDQIADQFNLRGNSIPPTGDSQLHTHL